MMMITCGFGVAVLGVAVGVIAGRALLAGVLMLAFGREP